VTVRAEQGREEEPDKSARPAMMRAEQRREEEPDKSAPPATMRANARLNVRAGVVACARGA
jgi:hypothetical protein